MGFHFLAVLILMHHNIGYTWKIRILKVQKNNNMNLKFISSVIILEVIFGGIMYQFLGLKVNFECCWRLF